MGRRKKLPDEEIVETKVNEKTGKFTQKSTRKKFEVGFIPIAENLSSLGFTEKDIALVLNVAPGTIQTWKHRNEDFRLACEQGMKNRISQIAAKGQMAAIGYDYEEVVETFEPRKNEETGEKNLELTQRKVYKKHKAPDSRLIEFFLINYAPDMFRSITKIESDNSKNLIIADGTGQVTAQLEKLAGAFLESRKKVECKVVENEVGHTREFQESDSENSQSQHPIQD